VEVRLLGPVDAVVDGNPITLGGPKERAVLAVLALAAGDAVSETRLIEAIWGDEPPRTATKTLHSYVSRLRKALTAAPDGAGIETLGNGYRLAGVAVDVDRVEQSVRDARDAMAARRPDAAATILRETLGVWRGDPLAGLGDLPFLAAAVARLDELRLAALELRVECDLACGRHEELIGELEHLVAEWPLREQLWAARMLALYRSGRQADALRAYQELRDRLLAELGLDPGPEVRDLERAILNQDPALDHAAGGLPAGDVTFVFTDIEGSTALFERLGDRYLPILEDHRRIIRDAIRREGGAEVRVEGDGFFLAFSDAAAAVRACVAAQAALQSFAWPAGNEPKVRMGMHCGVAQPMAGDYIALAVHQAARVAAAAHGGQVLLSSAAKAAASAAFDDTVIVTDVGVHQLRDFAEPQHLFQVAVPGLPSSFPPLRTLSILSHNLPMLRTSFVGRHEDRSEVARQVLDNGIVTIAGPGGVGKTRLAIEVASSVVDRFPDGVWLVELAPLTDGAQVVPSIAAVLHVDATPGRGLEELVVEAVRPKLTLIVLDNCEHVIDAAAAFTELVTHAAPNVAVLSTSREALRVDGEAIWRLPALDVPDQDDSTEAVAAATSVRLFLERALLVDARFVLNDDSAPLVAQICRRLDGIPLAIELAAARLGDLPLSDITAGLDDRFALLTGGRRTALPRQQTLEAAMAWSYELLNDDEQALWRRLSVFPAGASTAAAQAVCAFGAIHPDRIPGLLSGLVNRSVVHPSGVDGRYVQLETVAEFGRAQLATSGERDETETRFLAWARDTIATTATSTASDHAWAGFTASDIDNILAALNVALSRDPAAALDVAARLQRWWDKTGQYAEGRRWLERALEVGRDAHELVRADALSALALLSQRQADFPVVMEAATTAIDTYRRHDSPKLPTALNILAAAHFHMRDYARALPLFEEMLVHARAGSDKTVLAQVATNLGMMRSVTGNADEGRVLLEEALELWRDLESSYGASAALSNLAQVAFMQGRFGDARRLLDEALMLQREHGDVFTMVQALTNAGVYAIAEGDLRGSRAYLEQAIELARSKEVTLLLHGPIRNLADVETMQGRAKQARALYDEALDLGTGNGDRIGVQYTRYGLGALSLREERYDEALQHFSEAARLRREAGLTVMAADALAERSWVEVAIGDLNRAAATLAEADELAGDDADPRSVATITDAHAELARARGDYDVAIAGFKKSVALRWELVDVANLHESLQEAATTLIESGEAERGVRLHAAVERLRDDRDIVLLPFSLRRFERAMTLGRAALRDRFDDVWSAGKELDLAAAVALVLE
jgi:predicted ATPase/DNA-binding SARP family transcriptional activator